MGHTAIWAAAHPLPIVGTKFAVGSKHTCDETQDLNENTGYVPTEQPSMKNWRMKYSSWLGS